MTRHLIKILAMITTLAAPSIVTAQPYSKSMAQCAGLALAMAHWVHDQGRHDAIQRVARRWKTAAVEQATLEGVADAQFHVEKSARDREQEVVAKGKFYVFSEDYRDWISYCRSFGNHMGLDLTAEG